MPNFKRTKPFKIDHDKLEKTLKRLEATRGNTVDDVNDLPDSLPLDRTTAMFFGPGTKRGRRRRGAREAALAEAEEERS